MLKTWERERDYWQRRVNERTGIQEVGNNRIDSYDEEDTDGGGCCGVSQMTSATGLISNVEHLHHLMPPVSEMMTPSSHGMSTINTRADNCMQPSELQSYVKSLVHTIVSKECESDRSMQQELESALSSKAELESRVKELHRKSERQSRLLESARREKHLTTDKFHNEMEVALTKKASELKKCIEMALHEAETSKKRSIEMARHDMETEIVALKSQLDSALRNGAHLDDSMSAALDMVESNHEALREAVESDARSAVEVKNEIEKSFVTAVEEFESWSDHLLSEMETLVRKQSHGNNYSEEELRSIKAHLESAMRGMTDLEARLDVHREDAMGVPSALRETRTFESAPIGTSVYSRTRSRSRSVNSR